MRFSIKLKFILLSIIFLNIEWLYAQGNSERFVHGVDHFVEYIPDTILKTSFLKEKIELLIASPNAQTIQIGVLKFNGVEYFTMYSLDNEGEILSGTIGDFPCPENCIPPESVIEKDSLNPGRLVHKFDVLDLRDILSHHNEIKYLNVKRATHGLAKTPTVAIYAVTQFLGMNPKEQTDEKDWIFISVNLSKEMNNIKRE